MADPWHNCPSLLARVFRVAHIWPHQHGPRARIHTPFVLRQAVERERTKNTPYTRKSETAFKRWKWAVRKILLQKTLTKLSVAAVRVPNHMSVGARLDGLEKGLESFRAKMADMDDGNLQTAKMSMRTYAHCKHRDFY